MLLFKIMPLNLRSNRFVGQPASAAVDGALSPPQQAHLLQLHRAIREAIHPARPGWYEEFYATVMNTTMREYEAEG